MDILVPSVGESITEGKLLRWLKADGAFVKANEPLFGSGDGQGHNRCAESGVGRSQDRRQTGNSRRHRCERRQDRREGQGTCIHSRSNAESEAAERWAARRAGRTSTRDGSGVDTNNLSGSGRGGLVTKESVQTAIDKQTPSALPRLLRGSAERRLLRCPLGPHGEAPATDEPASAAALPSGW